MEINEIQLKEIQAKAKWLRGEIEVFIHNNAQKLNDVTKDVNLKKSHALGIFYGLSGCEGIAQHAYCADTMVGIHQYLVISAVLFPAEFNEFFEHVRPTLTEIAPYLDIGE